MAKSWKKSHFGERPKSKPIQDVRMSGFLSVIRDELADKEFRGAYVAENARRGVAYQTTAMREARGWSRAEFARRAGKPQSNVSRWEDPSYGKYSLSTLIEIASIFDVGLIVRFASFEEMLGSTADLRPSKLAVPNYGRKNRNKALYKNRIKKPQKPSSENIPRKERSERKSKRPWFNHLAMLNSLPTRAE